MAFLDTDGLAYFWEQIVARIGSEMENVSVDLTGYATTEDLEDYALKTDLDTLEDTVNASIANIDLSEYAKTTDLADYAKTADLPDHSNYLQQVYLVDDGAGNVSLATSSEAAAAAEGVEF